MNILVIGANGQLGSEVVKAGKAAGHNVEPMVRADMDFKWASPLEVDVEIDETISDFQIECVINCTALHRIDDCQAQPGEAFWMNSAVPEAIAGACANHDVKFVHISTDYVFGFPYKSMRSEFDEANPLSIYGASKLMGEWRVRLANHNHVIARVAGLFGAAGSSAKGGNFVETIIKNFKAGQPFDVTDDRYVTPTYAADAAAAIIELATEYTGTFHVVSADQPTSWHEFADLIGRAIRADTGLNVPVISPKWAIGDFGIPLISSLDRTKLDETCKTKMRPLAEALDAYLLEKGHLPPVSASFSASEE